MSVDLKALVRAAPAPRKTRPRLHAAALAAPAAAVLLGFFGAQAPLLGSLRPLGLCAAACAPGLWALPAAAAAAAGYALALSPGALVPYLACLAALAALRLPGAGRGDPLLPAAGGALCFALVRMGLALFSQQPLGEIFAACAESMLMLGLAYLLGVFFALPSAVLHGGGAEQRAAACAAFMAALACLAPYTLWGLSPAHFAAALAVLVCAARCGAPEACAVGAAALAAAAAAEPDALFAAAGIAAGGLAAGLLGRESRAACAAAFFGAGLLGAVCAPDAGPALLFAAELAAACLAFALLPARALAPAGAARVTGAAPAAAGRLQALSAALASAGEALRAVCRRADSAQKAEPALADAVAQRCCSGCAKRFACWVDHANDCYAAFAELDGLLREGVWIGPEQLPGPLAALCSQPDKLAAATNAAHVQRAQRRGARTQDGAARAALCEQYAVLAGQLGALAGQLSAQPADRALEKRIARLFEKLGLAALDVSAQRAGGGRLCVTVYLPAVRLCAEELDALAAELGRVCRRTFSRPRAAAGPAMTALVFREAPRFRAQLGACSLPAAEGGVCADTARAFLCEDGCICAVLCDGMGTGRAARADSALAAQLAARLLKAGFAPAGAARLVNAALALKNGGADESATTLDILKVDLYTGEAQLFKAGAAPSYLVRSGAVRAESAESVPLGILDRVIGRTLPLTLRDGDVAVLASDGAAAGGSAFTRALAGAQNEDAKALALRAAHAARKAAQTPDDVTVLALRLSAGEVT